MAKKQQELRKLAQDSNAADKLVAEKENLIRVMEVELEQMNKDSFEVVPDAASFPFFLLDRFLKQSMKQFLCSVNSCRLMGMDVLA